MCLEFKLWTNSIKNDKSISILLDDSTKIHSNSVAIYCMAQIESRRKNECKELTAFVDIYMSVCLHAGRNCEIERLHSKWADMQFTMSQWPEFSNPRQRKPEGWWSISSLTRESILIVVTLHCSGVSWEKVVDSSGWLLIWLMSWKEIIGIQRNSSKFIYIKKKFIYKFLKKYIKILSYIFYLFKYLYTC